MDTIDCLKEALASGHDVYLSSSVFRELTLSTPSVTLWTEDGVINITSTKDYNSYQYYNKNKNTKICDVYDVDTIIDIYNATNGYTPKDIKINGLIGIFSRLSKTK